MTTSGAGISPPPIVLVMGVSGSGKTTVGSRLADRLGVPFVDGDDLHPAANVAKMSSGRPLDDLDRWPWLDAVRAELVQAMHDGTGLVVACSALREAYRKRLVGPNEPVRTVFLDGPKAVIERRLSERAGHYMPTGLLGSQFETLERPTNALILDVSSEPDALVEAIIRDLEDSRRTE